ncbi:gp193 [Brochothrix phage A9]|uniref:Gp193 n=1 Tax=Brochothrix phage A9 TaxID=857312 RepID=D9J0Z1_9CAUD|nr:gp193 [Brochothrix phage A9]ADJ53228.1 gp193 [Brochothrix phage A9]
MTVSANLLVRTPDRVARVHVGDYIVRQEDGVCDVYSPEEFHKIYEVLKEG